MLEKLMPRSDAFFDDFDAQADATVRGARLLLALFEDFTDIERKVAAIKEVEHEGDNIAHRAYESDADALGRAAIAALFKSGADPLSIMKWKEIYDLMETATDRCEDVANVIEGVVLEHA